jgi:hypothetical protein
MPRSKRLNPNLQQEKRGLILLQQVVNEMRCIWRPTPNDDYGNDGDIEIVIGDAPTNQFVKVQSKSGRSYIHNPKFSQFDYYASEPDLKYWDGCNVPVVLVVHDPTYDDLYWKDVQGYIKSNPQVWSKPHTIRFSRRSDLFDRHSYVKLCALVITEEAELNDLLKGCVQESLRSNLLPAIENPHRVFQFSLSTKAGAELSESGASLPERLLSKGERGLRYTFCDPLAQDFPAKAWLDPGSVRSLDTGHLLHEKGGQRVVVELANKALAIAFASRGLLEREKGHRFYFAPEEGPQPREVTWQTPFKQASRRVAYPYLSKTTGEVAFWVHHSLRARFRLLCGQWLLQMEPGYVFTRDGITYVAAEHVGRLTTRKISHERNRQVLNHLLFWAWFLRGDQQSITIACGQQRFAFDAAFAGGRASFGIPTDRRRMREVVTASPDMDWNELEQELSDETQAGD